MRLFAQHYNTMFVNNLGDDSILESLSGECSPGDEFMDLCCGSGRVLTFPLKQQGVKAVGIDNDSEMLAAARIFLQSTGASDYELIEADALGLNFCRRFRVVTCVSHCMSFFRDTAAKQRLLEQVYNSLVTGGLFFIESYAPGNPKDGYYRRLTFAVGGGELICTLRVGSEVDDSDTAVVKTFAYDLELGNRKEQEVYKVGEVHLPLIIEMATKIGYRVEGVYGDSNASVPFDRASETQSLLLKKV